MRCVAICIFGSCLWLGTIVSAAVAAAPAAMSVSAEDRCQVCGMFVAPYPNWLAVAEMKDGRRFFFDGPKDLFVFVFEIATYLPGQSQADIGRLWVTEYYTAQPLAASEAIFVVGSDVLGPMGQELVPVLGLEQARTFRRDHGGTKLLHFDGKDMVAEGE